MQRNHPTIFKHRAWTPSDLQGLTGLSPVNLRDLRRRNLVPKNESRKFKLETVCQLLLLSELASHGFGPKSVRSIAESFADLLREHALRNQSAWIDKLSHSAWLNSAGGSPPEANLILIERADEKAISAKELPDTQSLDSGIVTIVDLRILGAKLAEQMAHRPSVVMKRIRGESQ